MKKYFKNKVIIIFIISFLLIVTSILFINYAFFKPTKLNAFIAAKIYKSPANTTFTDDGFYKCVIDSYNRDKTDGEELLYTDNISDEQLKSIEGLYCSGYTGFWQESSVQNIDGIESMSNLKWIDLYVIDGNHNGDYIPTYTLDLSVFEQLEDVSLESVWLKEIHIGNNEKLGKITLDNTGTVNLSGNLPVLTDLNIEYSIVNQLNLESSTNLKNLNIQNADLKSINLSNNTKLVELDLSNNELNNIDLSNNTELEKINLGYNQIKSIDLSNKKAPIINIYNNQINSINLSNNTELIKLYAHNNQIKNIDLSDSPKLTGLHLSNNLLSSIDLSNNKLLISAELDENQLINVNVSDCTDLDGLELSDNQLQNIDLTNNTNLSNLYLQGNNLNSVDLSNNSKLLNLDLTNNELNSIDLTNNIELKKLALGNNNLKEINLSKNTKLEALYLNDNELINAPLNSDLNLITLDLSGNMLTELDLTNYTTIKSLYLNNSKNLKKVLIDDVNQFTEFEIEVFHKMIGYPSIENVHETIDNFLISEKSLGRIIVGEYRWYQGEYVPPIGYSDLENFELNIEDRDGGLTETSYEVVYGAGFDRKIRINYEFHIPNITSDKYKINKDTDYIYTQTDTKTDEIKQNITANYGTFDISDNKIHIKYDDYIAKSLNLLNYSIKDFPYTTDAYDMYEYIYIPNEVLYSNEIYNKIECNGCYVNLIQNDVVNNASEQIQIKTGDIIEIGFEQAEIKEQYKIKYINNNIPEVYNIVLNNDINKDLKWYKGYDGSLSADISLFYSLIYENIVVKISKNDVDLTDKFNVNIDGLSNTKKLTISNKDKTLESGEYNVDFIIDGYSIKNFKFNIEELILVSEIDIENITLLNDNKLKEINYTINPSNATNKSILFEIEDESIAIIENNKIKGLKEGETTLTLKATDGSNIEKTIAIKVINQKIELSESTNYKITEIGNNKYIENIVLTKANNNIEPLTKMEFISNFEIFNAEIYEKNGTTLVEENDAIIKTGMIVKVGNDNYNIVIKGDVNGDGLVGSNDALLIRRHMVNLTTLDDIYLRAGDVDSNSLSSLDSLLIRRFIIGLGSL